MDIQKILVLSNGELIGDGLVKLPFVRAVRHEFSKAHITWMTRNGCVYGTVLRDVVRGLLDDVIEHTHFGSSFAHMLFPLTKTPFDMIINPELRWNRTYAAYRIPHKIFYSRYSNFWLSDIKQRIPLPKRPPHVLDDLMWLLSNYFERDCIPDHTPIKIPEIYQGLAHTLIPDGIQAIGLAPGSGGRHKCWPLEHYIRLGHLLYGIGYTPVYLIGPQEIEWFPRLKSDIPFARFPLQETTDSSVYVTLACAQRLKAGIANDAGGAHLMATSGHPLFVLYGPTPPTEFVPNTPLFYPITLREYMFESLDQLTPECVVSTVIKTLTIPQVAAGLPPTEG